MSAPGRNIPPRRPNAIGEVRRGGGFRRGGDYSQDPNHLWMRLFIRSTDEDVERLRGYRPGEYNSIHLDDELNDGQYRVIHKLGHGTYATVWLCLVQSTNEPSYVAIKIFRASQGEDDREFVMAAKLKGEGLGATQHLCLPTNQFTDQSPSGMHICVVYPMVGPSVRIAASIFHGEESKIRNLQTISADMVKALAALHSRGICHGGKFTFRIHPRCSYHSVYITDFHPRNILLVLNGLDGLDEEGVFSLLGEPEIAEVCIAKDSHPTPEIPYAPKYLVYPVAFEDVASAAISAHAQVIDFGQSFDNSFGPPQSLGIPVNYAAPEVILDGLGSMEMDLWSLGCAIFEVHLGQRLFTVFQLVKLRKEEYMDEVSPLLGEPPEQWLEYYAEPSDESGSEGPPTPRHDNHGDASSRVKAIRERIAECHDCSGEGCTHPRFELISEAEATDLADLLEKLLRWRPEERLGTRNIMKHAWFNTQY